MGFAFSTRQWLLFLNQRTPVEGLTIYYIILYGSLLVLSRMGLVVFGLKIDDPIKTFGLLLITFAFFITVNFENPYVQLVTMGNTQGASPVFYGSEDGAVWFLVSQFVSDIWLCRMLTFVVTPFLLTVLNVYMASKDIFHVRGQSEPTILGRRYHNNAYISWHKWLDWLHNWFKPTVRTKTCPNRRCSRICGWVYNA